MEVFDRTEDEIAQFLDGDELGDRHLEAVAGGISLTDYAFVIQDTMRNAYLEQMQDLQSQAEKVSYFNDQKRSTREYLASLRASSSETE